MVLGVLLLILGAITAVARWVSRHPDRVRAWTNRQLNRPRILVLRRRYRIQLAFLLRRVSPEEAFGLSLTIGLILLVLCGWAFGEVLDAVIDREEVAALDSPVTSWLVAHRTPLLTVIMKVVTQLGGLWVLAPLLTIVGLVAALRYRQTDAPGFLAASSLGTAALVAAIKLLIARPRPRIGAIVATYGGYAFPSGHSAQAVAAYAALAFLIARSVGSWRRRVIVWAAAVMLAAVIGFSRLYLGAHWLTDVLGGFALGGAWLALLVTTWTTYRHRRSARSQRSSR